MGRYRLYCLSENGAIDLAEWIDAVDDADAVRQANEAKPQARKCEVWQGKRLVVTLNEHAQATDSA